MANNNRISYELRNWTVETINALAPTKTHALLKKIIKRNHINNSKAPTSISSCKKIICDEIKRIETARSEQFSPSKGFDIGIGDESTEDRRGKALSKYNR
eukprot:149233_1